MASTYLTKTFSGGGSNTFKFTISAWVKRCSQSNGVIFSASSDYCYLGFINNKVFLEIHDGDNVRLRTTALYRDCNAWYHIVVSYDSTLSTSTDRMKMWINGERITAFDTANYPNQNYGTYMGTNEQHSVGRREVDDGSYFDGIISHLHLTVDNVYQASDFGETDSTTGEWKINTSPSVTYGNNGFFILKDGNSVTDQSGNSNNFTVGSGTLTKTEDCPSNVFATLNPLRNFSSMATFSNGNNTYSIGSNSWRTALSTLGVTSGKWYVEAKWATGGSYYKIGFAKDNGVASIGHIAETNLPGGYAWYTYNNGEVRTDSAVVTGWSSSDITNITSISVGDIMMVAVDMDNKYAYFGVNGTWAKNGDPTSGSSGTGGLDISADYPDGSTLFFGTSVYNTTGNINFGNGYFGTTAVSSAGTNASGIGIFEYDVPTGYTALSTKGLNE